jgi:CPA2 family monovalent cation:H+ antiporter-2
MQLRRFAITSYCSLVGKSLITSRLRDHYNCMLVGLEEGEENLATVSPLYLFKPGDILWIVGVESNVTLLKKES